MNLPPTKETVTKSSIHRKTCKGVVPETEIYSNQNKTELMKLLSKANTGDLMRDTRIV